MALGLGVYGLGAGGPEEVLANIRDIVPFAEQVRVPLNMVDIA